MNRRSFDSLVRTALGVAIVSGGFLATRLASADAAAPAFVQQRFGLSCAPDCTLCHARSPGSFGNIRTVTVNGQTNAFIAAIEACGFVPTDQNTWGPSFDACETNPALAKDTDGDGTFDMAELRAGTDPSDPTSGAQICGSGPSYGCVRIARGTPVDGLAALTSSAVLVAGIALMRRRRRP